MKKKILCTLTIISAALCSLFVPPISAEDTSNKFLYRIVDNAVIIDDYNVSSMIEGEIVIPSEIEGYPVKRIYDTAFMGFSNITNIVIPDTVTRIDGNAFRDCESLKNINIPDSVTYIGYDAFSSCKSLTNIVIPESVAYIGDNAFAQCTNLYSVTLPDSVEYIGRYAFYDTALYDDENNWEDDVLYIGNHLITAKRDSISGNYAIKDGTKTIASHAFVYCSGLTGITIPDSVTHICESSFEKCINLTNIVIPNSVTHIEYGVFRNCSALTDITMSDNLTFIGSNIFSGSAYYNDKSNWENDVLYIDNYLIKMNNTFSGDYIVKEDTKLIAEYAFLKCTGLSSIMIPDSITAINGSTFGGCSGLTEFTVPKSIKYIGDSAFSSCTNLNDIYYPGSKAEWDNIEKGIQWKSNCPAFIHYLDEPERILSYNANGGVNAPDSQVVQAYNPTTLSEETPIRAGFEFAGWAASPDADNAEYAPGIRFVSSSDDQTLYAVWRLVSYTTTSYQPSVGKYNIYNVTPTNVAVGNEIIFACYKNGALVNILNAKYNNMTITFVTDCDYDEIKVFTFDSLSSMLPTTACERVLIQQNI